jgi:hypothetical protein
VPIFEYHDIALLAAVHDPSDTHHSTAEAPVRSLHDEIELGGDFGDRMPSRRRLGEDVGVVTHAARR